ncbi:MAG: type II toxin-antitoxin system VapC family toxin [Capsulimonadaceae bacterium]
MKYLLDTCTFNWVVAGAANLSLQMSLSLFEQAAYSECIDILPVTVPITEVLQVLPFHPGHSDPFDRTIISTALQGNWTVITPDEKFDHYKGLMRVW